MELLQKRVDSEWQEMAGRMLADVNARVSAVHDHISLIDTTVATQKQARTEVGSRFVLEWGLAR